MIDDFPNDPDSQSLEARLIAHRPTLPDREGRDLLYQCAFSAGKHSAIRGTRRWQFAFMSMTLLVLGLSIPRMHESLVMARSEPAANQPGVVVQIPTPRNVSTSWSRVVAVPLDAWQVQANTDTSFDSELAKFKQMKANSRSLAAGTWKEQFNP